MNILEFYRNRRKENNYEKTMILTSMALMSLVAVGCANEEVKDMQDNQLVVSTNMEEVQTEGNVNTKKPLIVYFSYGEIVHCHKM